MFYIYIHIYITRVTAENHPETSEILENTLHRDSRIHSICITPSNRELDKVSERELHTDVSQEMNFDMTVLQLGSITVSVSTRTYYLTEQVCLEEYGM